MKVLMIIINMEITFQEKEHKYLHYTGKIYISVTTLINKYKPKFDEDYWSTYKAIERLLGIEEFKIIKKKIGYENIVPIYQYKNINKLKEIKFKILEEWSEKRKIACENGTQFHKEQEYITNRNKICPETFYLYK